MATTYSAVPAAGTSRRLISLDVARGLTIAFMILVNNNGSETLAYWPLKHAEWNGWTPTDLIFPSFLFIVGISTVFATEARMSRGDSRGLLLRHTVQRALILLLIGLFFQALPHFDFAHMRIYGVLQRIAVCYLVASALYLWYRRAGLYIVLTALCLGTYWIIMRYVPVPGFGVPTHDLPILQPTHNWTAILDRHVFPGRLYERVRDPEGLLSTLPAFGTIFLGMLTGMWLRTEKTLGQKAIGLFGGALTGLVLGQLWNLSFPINKKMWTSSYVLFAAGCTLLILAIFYTLIEVRRQRGAWTYPWLVFGSNAITAYICADVIAITLEHISVHSGTVLVPLQQYIYTDIFSHIVSPAFGSLLYSLCFVAVCFVPVMILYRRKIFIKI